MRALAAVPPPHPHDLPYLCLLPGLLSISFPAGSSMWRLVRRGTVLPPREEEHCLRAGKRASFPLCVSDYRLLGLEDEDSL